MSTTSELIAGHPEAWRAATTSPFLDGAADGTLHPEAFDRWLEQDHRFVEALVRAWGLVVQPAPRRDLALLVGGMRAFTDELAWFEGIAATRGLDLSAPERPETATYNRTLLRLGAAAYPVAITAMWAVEAAYLTAWQGALPGAAPYAEFVTHWANDAFAAFVTDLGRVVDRELPRGPTPEAAAAFVDIAHHEAAFWSMTMA